MYYDFNEFLENVQRLRKKYGEYIMEILFTEFFCANQGINPNIIYITPPINDAKIDSIVICNENKKHALYAIQITCGKRDKDYLDEFNKKDIFSIEKYKDILSGYDKKNTVVRKIFIAMKWDKCYELFRNIIILSNKNNELNLMLYEYAFEKKLISNKSKFKNEYINQLKKREKMWLGIHRREKNNEIGKLYTSILQKNYKFMDDLENNFIEEIEKVVENRIALVIKLFGIIETKEKRKEILNMNKEEREILLDTFEFTGMRKTNYEDLINLILGIVKVKKRNNVLQDIKFIPTKTYISIFDKEEKNLAYLYYVYNRKNIKNAIFCFACKFEDIKKDYRFDEYIIEKIIQEKTDKPAMSGKHTIVHMKELRKYLTDKGEEKEFLQELMNLLEMLLEESIK